MNKCNTPVVDYLVYERECVCFLHTYCSTVHDESHLSGLVDVTSEGDARTDTPVAAVVCSSSES